MICGTCSNVIPDKDRYCAYCGSWQLGPVEAALAQEYTRRLRAKNLVSENPIYCRYDGQTILGRTMAQSTGGFRKEFIWFFGATSREWMLGADISAERVAVLFEAGQSLARSFPHDHVAHIIGTVVEGLVLYRLHKDKGD